jgi:hypothetical protein
MCSPSTTTTTKTVETTTMMVAGRSEAISTRDSLLRERGSAQLRPLCAVRRAVPIGIGDVEISRIDDPVGHAGRLSVARRALE